LGLTTAPVELEKQKIAYKNISDYLSLFSEKKLILELGVQLLSSVSVHPSVSIEETHAYLGLSYWNLQKTFGEVKAKEMYNKHGRQAFLPTDVMKKILNFEKPDLVITTCSPRAEEAALKAAKELNIKSAFIVNLYMFDLFKNREFFRNEYADHVFLPTKAAYEMMIKYNRSPETMTVSGNPSFESHFDPIYIKKASVLREILFPKCDYIILFAKASSHTTFAKMDQNIQNALISFVSKNPKFGLILRGHPNENLIQDQGFGENIVELNQENISVLLNACDIAVTQVSTVGIEAHLIGKQMYYICDDSYRHFQDTESGTRAKSPDDLIIKIMNFKPPVKLNDKKSYESKENNLKSTDIIVKKIIELIM
ncbi:MAG: hypothetical protein ABL927_14045, partial [Bdellovibrionales bacterium]